MTRDQMTKLLFDGLEEQEQSGRGDPYVWTSGSDYRDVIVDGSVDLVALADKILAALRG